MFEQNLSGLIFPNMTFGKYETPWDLVRWIYKGGSKANVRTVTTKITSGQLGQPLMERIELVHQIHEVLSNYLDRGSRRETVRSVIDKLTLLFRWADENNKELSLASIESSYLHWTDWLLHRVRIKNDLSERTAYSYGSVAGWALDRVLERSIPIVKTTRLSLPKRTPRAVRPQADKQNLEETFALGHFLLDIADALHVDAIWGPIPVRIQLRNGIALEEWSGLKRSETLKPPNPKYPNQTKFLAKKSAQKRAKWTAETTFRTRYPLINLRIQAEMFMLMGQPAVNLAQTHQLRMDQWRYKPSTHGYEIRTYKHRRWGPVVFEIYSQYRQVFERYLKWRTAIFPDDPNGLLFPLLGHGGKQTTRHPEKHPMFNNLKNACVRAGIKYLPPSALRQTNVNWLLRRTQDPDLTANEKQHAVKTLLSVYEKPSLQRAMVQIKNFWAQYDPAQAAVGIGTCLGKTPEPIANKPAPATQPDCLTPTGCLFCKHLREIDSFDHVWSLASFRLLKSFELGAQAPVEPRKAVPKHPAEIAIERITAKVNYIKNSSPQRGEWVQEALLRIEEGRYHPTWAWMIESL
ncbi:hypothetical protein [Comamonas sp. E6]|uniref:hypothetical protein n=1 Tax=Comamonas sp. E6 TaxID=364029 RepID=UPI00062F633B|nr:hypothetical protein [Comamonas sp. E6]GAO72514.1 hypothetical protein CSE6_024_39510 [Comamonas sp. E6]